MTPACVSQAIPVVVCATEHQDGRDMKELWATVDDDRTYFLLERKHFGRRYRVRQLRPETFR